MLGLRHRADIDETILLVLGYRGAVRISTVAADSLMLLAQFRITDRHTLLYSATRCLLQREPTAHLESAANTDDLRLAARQMFSIGRSCTGVRRKSLHPTRTAGALALKLRLKASRENQTSRFHIGPPLSEKPKAAQTK